MFTPLPNGPLSDLDPVTFFVMKNSCVAECKSHEGFELHYTISTDHCGCHGGGGWGNLITTVAILVWVAEMCSVVEMLMCCSIFW